MTAQDPVDALATALHVTGHVGADRPDVVADVLAALPPGWRLVSVEDVARRAWNMTYGETFPWESMSKWWHDTYTDKARRLLGAEDPS